MRRWMIPIVLVASLLAPVSARAEACSLTVCVETSIDMDEWEWCHGTGDGRLQCFVSAWISAHGRDRVAVNGTGLPGEVSVTARLVECVWTTDLASGNCLAGPTRLRASESWGPLEGTTSATVSGGVSTLGFFIPISGPTCVQIYAEVEVETTAHSRIDAVIVDGWTTVIAEAGGFLLCFD